ncbi:hypothetical protein [Mycolicibacterium sp. XJ870]
MTESTDDELGPGDTLPPSEATDSDEVANDDGDEVVDPPEEWHAAEPSESLDRKLEAEEPDVPAGQSARADDKPDDGEDSLFPVVR